jgi:hydrogenase expression/formation protein HypC
MMNRLGARIAAGPQGSAPNGTEAIAHCHDSHCITCSDEAVALRVVRVDGGRELALCENDDGERTSVEIALVSPVAAGDVLLVHAGTALAHAAEARA